MGINHFLTVGLLALGASALPQTASDSSSGLITAASATGTGVSPSQSAEFKSSLAEYYSSLKDSPQFSQIGIALAIADPSALAAIESNPSTLLPITGTSIDLASLATDPPLTFPTYSWYSTLDAQLISSIQGMQTSAALAIASIDQQVIGKFTSISVPSATGAAASSSSSGGAGAMVAKPTGVAAMGAAIGAFGAAVALL